MHATLKDGTNRFLTGSLYKVANGKRTLIEGKVASNVVKLIEMKLTSESAFQNANAVIKAISKGNAGDTFEVDFDHPEQGVKTCYRITRAELVERASLAAKVREVVKAAESDVPRIAEFETASNGKRGRVSASGPDEF